MLPIAQLASVTGVYGLSFLLALIRGRGAAADRRARAARRWIAAVAVACAGRRLRAVGPLADGGRRLRSTRRRRFAWRSSRATSPRTRSGIRRCATTIIGRYVVDDAARRWRKARRSSSGRSRRRPFSFERRSPRPSDPAPGARDRRDAAHRQRPGRARSAGRTARRVRNRFYNAAFLVKPDGTTGAVYRKMHLVPFGEYVPLQRLLFFVGPIVEAVSNFTPGDRAACCCRWAGRR